MVAVRQGSVPFQLWMTFAGDLTGVPVNLHDSRRMPLNGVMVVDKPAGWTSHDVVARMRHILGERSIGHLGTLDPMATGVLPLVLGRMTRLAQFYTASKSPMKVPCDWALQPTPTTATAILWDCRRKLM